MRRGSDRKPDDAPMDAVRGLVIGLALVALAVALAALMLPAHAQTLVLMDRADYVRGAQTIECILDAVPVAVQYSSLGLYIRCHSDADGIFGNGFEGAP